MVTKEEVVLAYRLFLGREPENEHVVNNLAQTSHSIEKLRSEFLISSEFRQLASKMLEVDVVDRHRHPFNTPFIPVETEISEPLLTQLFSRIQEQWFNLGNSEPYWSVLTQPQYFVDNFDNYSEQFFFSGDGLCFLFLAALRRNGVNPNLLNSCLELGSGVGRVTIHLADKFPHVTAVDVSKPHLEILRQKLTELHIENVDIQQLEKIDQLSSLPKCDAVFTVITLQHNPPPVSASLLKALLDLLNPKGVAYFQIATYKTGYLFEVERYLPSEQSRSFEMHFLPQHDIFKIIQEANCICLEVREDGMVGNEDSMLSNTFLVQKNA